MLKEVTSIEDLVNLKEQCKTKQKFVLGLKNIIEDLKMGDKIRLSSINKQDGLWVSEVTTSSNFLSFIFLLS